MPALGMTQAEFARRLGVSRLTVNELLNEKRRLTPELAARLARLLNTSAESWREMQTTLDLWEIAQHPERLQDVEPIRETV